MKANIWDIVRREIMIWVENEAADDILKKAKITAEGEELFWNEFRKRMAEAFGS